MKFAVKKHFRKAAGILRKSPASRSGAGESGTKSNLLMVDLAKTLSATVPVMPLVNNRNRFHRPFAAVLLAATATALQAGPAADYTWRNVTVGAGGFAPNIIFSRAERGLAYLRTDMGGAYRRDAAGRWQPLQDAMTESSYFGIESIAPDPADADRVYIAAGMYRRDGAAILRSDDRGETWDVVPVPFRMGGNEDGRGLGERLAVDPNNGNILYFGSRHDGLQRSTDRGASWARVEAFPHAGRGLPGRDEPTNAGIAFVVFDPSATADNRSKFIYAGVADPGEHHLYRSVDGGKSWSAVPGEPPAHLLPVQAEIDDDGVLYIAYSNGIGPNGVTAGAVYKFDTRSGAWTDITPDKSANPPPGGYMGLSLDRRSPGTLMVATMNRWQPGDTLWRSTDGGRSWTDLRHRSRRDVGRTPFLLWGNKEADFGWWIAGLAVDPFDGSRVAYTTGATVYATENIDSRKTIDWEPWVTGVEQTAIITLASLPEGPPLLSGFGDISGFVHEDLAVSPPVEAMFTDPLFANTNTIDYAGLAPGVVVRSGTPPHRSEGEVPTHAYSTDYGRHWQPVDAPEHEGETGSITIVVSADGKRFMLATPRPVWTGDRGKTWKRAKGLPRSARPVADKADPEVFYAMDFEKSRVLISRDGGGSFTALETTGLPGDIAGDRPTWREIAWPLTAAPGHAGQLWFLSQKGLFRSNDHGRSFQRVGTDIAVEELSFGKPRDEGSRPTLFAIGSREGERAIWRSDNNGEHWIKLNGERHQYGRRFRTLTGDLQHYGRVYVGTDGRGIVYGEPAAGVEN